MGSVQIVIADDEPYIVRSLSFILQRADIPFDVARNGEEALQKVRQHTPAILFLDIMMPKISGFDVCAQIKKDPDTRSTHIIMLTAKGEEEDKQKGLSAGADEYITKPFSPREILARVSKLLKS